MGIFDDIRDDFDVERDFTFDIEKARLELNSSDPISTILRGHLYIENGLDELLKIELKKPELINLSDINFSVKSRLCAALGLIDQRTSNVCLKINKIRNSLSHHIHSNIELPTVLDVLNEYHPSLREEFISHIEKEDGRKIDLQNPTKIMARLVRDFVGILQGNRRAYQIHVEKRETALKIIIQTARESIASNSNADSDKKTNPD